MLYSAPIEAPSMGSYELILKTGKYSSVRNVLHFENIFLDLRPIRCYWINTSNVLYTSFAEISVFLSDSFLFVNIENMKAEANLLKIRWL